MTNEYLAYIGTYTSLGSEGIYCYCFDMATGGLEYVGTTGAIDDPSFLDIAPSGKNLYAVCADFEAMTTGIVRAYSIDAGTGELTFLNEQSSEGTGPCHVEVDQTSRYVLLANYGSGSVASYPRPGGRKPWKGDGIRPARGVERRPRASGGAARALDQYRSNQHVRLRRRPRDRQGAGVQTQSWRRKSHAGRFAVCPHSDGGRAAPLRLSSERQIRP